LDSYKPVSRLLIPRSIEGTGDPTSCSQEPASDGLDKGTLYWLTKETLSSGNIHFFLMV
jgi:hypothetical protein